MFGIPALSPISTLSFHFRGPKMVQLLFIRFPFPTMLEK